MVVGMCIPSSTEAGAPIPNHHAIRAVREPPWNALGQFIAMPHQRLLNSLGSCDAWTSRTLTAHQAVIGPVGGRSDRERTYGRNRGRLLGNRDVRRWSP
jgi:hypothetical protein